MSEVKDLTINGQVYAKYHIRKNQVSSIMYFKLLIPIFHTDESASEDYLINLIEMVENTVVDEVGFLNISTS